MFDFFLQVPMSKTLFLPTRLMTGEGSDLLRAVSREGDKAASAVLCTAQSACRSPGDLHARAVRRCAATYYGK